MEMVAQSQRVSKLEVVVGLLVLVYIAVAMMLWINYMPSPPQLPANCYGPVMCSEKEGYAEVLSFYLLLGLAAVAGIPSAVLGFLEDLEYKRDG